jgi:hypothetical protein
MPLLEVLLSEHLVEVFQETSRQGTGLNAELLPESPEGVEDLLGGRSAVVRVRMTTGDSLMVTPRRIVLEEGATMSDLVVFSDLVGYDWISPELSDKVRLKDEHYDRMYLYLQGERTVVLDGLGPSVYPLMAYLGKVLELRSQKVLLRRLDDGDVEVISRCLRAATEGPFFEDDELDTLFAQNRAGMQILAAMWSRMNLAAPDLHRAVGSIMEMLLERQPRFPDAWDEHMDIRPERVRRALQVFKGVVSGREREA